MNKPSTSDQATLATAQARSTLADRLREWISVESSGMWPTRSMDDDLREAADALESMLDALDAIVITANKNANASPSVAAFNLAFDAIKKARG